MDVDLLACCWIRSERFRSGEVRSLDPATQRAIDALLAGGYRGLVDVAGCEVAARMIDRAAWADELRPKTLPPPPAPRARPALAPLEPDAFLRWCWAQLPAADRGDGPLKFDDLCFEFQVGDCCSADFRRLFVGLAAKVRRNQRLFRDPWYGIGVWMGWRN